MLFSYTPGDKHPYTDEEKARFLKKEQGEFFNTERGVYGDDDYLEEEAPTKRGELEEARKVLGRINNSKRAIVAKEKAIKELRDERGI